MRWEKPKTTGYMIRKVTDKSVYEGFSAPERVSGLAAQIRREAAGEYLFMEVCGGHTRAIRANGLDKLLPPCITLLSGPGCPVCVTPAAYIDHAVSLSADPDVITATFGDLLRVPGSRTTLEKEKAAGGSIVVVYSVNEAVQLAIDSPDKRVVFLATGFETTAPGSAAGLAEAVRLGAGNFYLLSAHKVMPPAMKAVVEGGTRVTGFICPGHVSTITGSGIYEFLPRDYGVGCVISGFEPADILLSVLMLVRQVNLGEPRVEIQYGRAVRPEGNPKALSLMKRVFRESDEWWRGFGVITGSGLQPGGEFEKYDARFVFPAFADDSDETGDCICGAILRGMNSPPDCPLFGSVCTPASPAGACMVSAEGACNVNYKYSNHA